MNDKYIKTLIVPIYKNESNIPSLLQAINLMHQKHSHGFEAIFVIDGSPDNSYNVLINFLPHFTQYVVLAGVIMALALLSNSCIYKFLYFILCILRFCICIYDNIHYFFCMIE